MRELLQDTAFGFLVRTITGGRLLAWEDQYDPNTLQKYLSTASTPMAKTMSRRAEQKEHDLEASGSDEDLKDQKSEDMREDYELVDWLPGDSKVS